MISRSHRRRVDLRDEFRLTGMHHDPLGAQSPVHEMLDWGLNFGVELLAGQFEAKPLWIPAESLCRSAVS